MHIMNVLKLTVVSFFIVSFITTDLFAENIRTKPQLAAATPVTPGSLPAPSASIPPSTSATTAVSHSSEKTGRLWNLQDADILSVINEVSQETGKNFVVDPRVNGKITLVSSKPIPQHELYQVFLSIISTIGYSAIPVGNVIKIVPNNESSEQLSARGTNAKPVKGEELTVRVIPLDSVQATQLIPALRPLLPQWSSISSYAPGNVLIIVGRANNLDRITEIVHDVDRSFSGGIEIVPLKYASATQVVTVLNNLQSNGRGGDSGGVSLAADERSNSILLNGPRHTRLKMRVLIAQLDAPVTTASGNTEVIYLKYLQAKALAPILGKVAQSMLGKDVGSASGASSSIPSVVSGVSIQTGAPGAANPNREPAIPTNIQAETNTNAVIITAPPTMLHALKTVIAKLDIRPAQVLVEAVIAQIDESNLNNLGITWGSPTTDPNSGLFGKNGFNPLGANNIGIIPRTNIVAILTALETLNGTDILSTPSIMTLDNQKATIIVGQDVPYQNGSYAPPGTATSSGISPYNTISSKPVTLQLDVTPQINLGDSVRMTIMLKNDSLQNSAAVAANPGTVQPLINTNQIKNKVIINSNDVLVLGGLISNQTTDNNNKVPLLSSIPIAGRLFQNPSTTLSRKNLIVFIKPIIIRNATDANTITEAKYVTTQQKHANYADDLQDLGKKPLTSHLPPWKNRKNLPEPFTEEEDDGIDRPVMTFASRQKPLKNLPSPFKD